MQIGVLTEEQKYQWKNNGYLVLKGVLSTEEIKNLTVVVDQRMAARILFLLSRRSGRSDDRLKFTKPHATK